jgi:hypothetical protein
MRGLLTLLFRTRAFENAVVVAMTNYPAPYMNGNSVAYGADASQLVAANGAEGVYMVIEILKYSEQATNT